VSSVPVDPTRLAVRVAALAASRARVIIGICGAPGAGKSTLAALVASEVNQDRPGVASVVPMDGFHLAKSVIAADERATRRGAPDTFDPDGYAALLERLREPGPDIVYAPEYRREIEDPVAGAIAVTRECRIVLTEGNYLLNPEPAWRRVRDCLDEVWYLEAPSEELRVEALIQRHQRFGKSAERARAHVLGTDQTNAASVATHQQDADLQLRWPSW
jgi:pantothenate kinase